MKTSHPIGKGMFIRHLSATGSPTAAASTAEKAGLKWVAVMLVWEQGGNPGPRNAGKVAAYADAFKARGIDVWGWGYPVPSRLQSFITHGPARARALQLAGFISDPEHEYKGKHKAAENLGAAVVKALGPLPHGVTSYGLPSYHKSFPYGNLAGFADFGMPQVYDLKDNQGPGYQAAGVREWRDLYGYRVLVPLLTTASSSPAELRQEWSQVPEGVPAVGFWDWQTTQSAEWAELAKLPPPGGSWAVPVGGSLLAIVGAFLAYKAAQAAGWLT